MKDYEQLVASETGKRFTLNLLIQGAATHTFFTAHHLVRDEIEAVDPKLIRCYDRTAPTLLLNYWLGDAWLFVGSPRRFWRRVNRPRHPFFGHRLLTKHGAALAEATKQHALRRAREKGLSPKPGLHLIQCARLYFELLRRERAVQETLVGLASEATTHIWKIDRSKLHAELTHDVAFGNLQPPKSFQARMMRASAVGYSGVIRSDGKMSVVAKATVWPLLVHELTKGTAELVCLHGMKHLDCEVYRLVTEEADRIEYEVWLMQAGAELWRRLLAANPPGRPIAETLMEVSRLDPTPLENLMIRVIEKPDMARRQIEGL